MTSYLVDSAHQTAGFDPIQYASDFVRRYCKQQFDWVAGDTILLNPRPDHTAQLPELPVATVTAVSAFMLSPTVGQLAWVPLTAYQWTDDGLLYDTTQITPPLLPVQDVPYPTWPSLPKSLQVTYSHGYQTIPDDLQNVVMRIATEVKANPMFVHSSKVGEINTVWPQNPIANGAHIYLRDQDKEILDSYSIVPIG